MWTAVAFSPLRMPCYVFVVWAFKPSNGGWVRLFGHFRTEQDARRTVAYFWRLLFASEYFIDYQVVRTIFFKKMNRDSGRRNCVGLLPSW